MEEEKTSLEQRVAKAEGILEEIRARLNHLESEIDSLRQEMNQEVGSLRQEMGNLRQEMHIQFRWTIGIMLTILIPMWVSIILAVVFT